MKKFEKNKSVDRAIELLKDIKELDALAAHFETMSSCLGMHKEKRKRIEDLVYAAKRLSHLRNEDLDEIITDLDSEEE